MKIHSDKGDEKKDEMKLQVMACSSLAFINKVYSVLIKFKTAEFYIYEKIPVTGQIVTSWYEIPTMVIIVGVPIPDHLSQFMYIMVHKIHKNHIFSPNFVY